MIYDYRFTIKVSKVKSRSNKVFQDTYQTRSDTIKHISGSRALTLGILCEE